MQNKQQLVTKAIFYSFRRNCYTMYHIVQVSRLRSRGREGLISPESSYNEIMIADKTGTVSHRRPSLERKHP